MPLYPYECEQGHRTTVICPHMERKPTVACEECGEPAERIYTPIYTPPPGAYPYLSDALGVSHDEVHEAAAECARLGVPTEFTEDGRAVIRDRYHRKRLCEEIGMFDRDAGYGDATRTGRALEVIGNMEADGEIRPDDLDFADVEKERTDAPIYQTVE